MNANCQLLTHSRMACAKSCLRRHFYAYEMGLRPIRETPPLRMGSSIHHGIEVFQTCDSQTFEDSILSALRAATLAYEQVPAGVMDLNDWAVGLAKSIPHPLDTEKKPCHAISHGSPISPR